MEIVGDQEHCPALISDAVHEILSRVPSSSLPDCRRVCSEWKQVIEDPAFRPLHSLRTNLISGCLVETRNYNYRHETTFVPFHSPTTTPSSPIISLDFIPRPVRILAVADRRGILCCITTDCCQGRYIVCKPATREWTCIPNPRTRFWACATAIVARPSGPHDYKIFRFSHLHNESWLLRCEVFDSRSWAWRRLKHVRVDLAVDFSRRTVYANGALNWLVITEPTILSFDIQEEIWELINLPEGAPVEHRFLDTFDGRLCLLHQSESKLKIWVMSDHEHRTWEVREVDMVPIQKETGRNHIWPVSMYTSRYMVAGDGSDLLWYDIKGRKQCCSRVLKDGLIAPRVFMFESDLEKSNLGAQRHSGTNLCRTTTRMRRRKAPKYLYGFLFGTLALFLMVICSVKKSLS